MFMFFWNNVYVTNNPNKEAPMWVITQGEKGGSFVGRFGGVNLPFRFRIVDQDRKIVAQGRASGWKQIPGLAKEGSEFTELIHDGKVHRNSRTFTYPALGWAEDELLRIEWLRGEARGETWYEHDDICGCGDCLPYHENCK